MNWNSLQESTSTETRSSLRAFVEWGAKDLEVFGQEVVETYEAAKERLQSGDPAANAEKKQKKKNEKNKNKRDKNLGPCFGDIISALSGSLGPKFGLFPYQR